MMWTIFGILLLVSSCVQNRAIYELDTGDLVECGKIEISHCGVLLKDCSNNIEYYCETVVRGYSDHRTY